MFAQDKGEVERRQPEKYLKCSDSLHKPYSASREGKVPQEGRVNPDTNVLGKRKVKKKKREPSFF